MKTFLARLFLKMMGWKPDGQRPGMDKYVIIAAPHTSNWDLPYMMAFAWHYEMKISWLGKHTIFKYPVLRDFFMWMGGVPIWRHLRKNVVQQMTDRFAERDALALVIPAEGTRTFRPFWKSGFYHIAHGAGVPIIPGFLDYARKTGGFGAPIYTTGDIKADMDKVRAFYSSKTGKFPEKLSTIILKEEMEDEENGQV